MKKNFDDLTELCREILDFNINGLAQKDMYSLILDEISTEEFERRLKQISEFLDNDLEIDGTLEEATKIKNGLIKKIESRKVND
jgi:hypothetical protein